MAEELKAQAVEAEEPKSIAEQEKEVLQNAGVTVEEDGMYKVNVDEVNKSKENQNAVQEQETKDGVLRGSSENEKAGEKAEVELQGVREEEKIEELPIIEEVTDETNKTNNTDETRVDGSPEAADAASEQEEVLSEEETQESKLDLPENVKDLVKFMNETGGTLEDYVRLNADYSNVDDNTLLIEYYKQTKPHLSYDEIQFLLEDKFSIDEDLDDERTQKRKNLALKEEVAGAKSFLENLKKDYYKEVKLGSNLLPEQQKAIEFFNRYNDEQKSAEQLLAKQTSHFNKETNNIFNKDFKGFNFNVDDKKYRFNIKDVNKEKESQTLSNVFDKYVDENNLLKNSSDFHKALFAAKNPDAIANHFYQQGKSDAIKQLSKDAKNINMDPRKTADGYVESGGLKVRAITGDSNSKLKLKLKNY
jgi:hypothetical protein